MKNAISAITLLAALAGCDATSKGPATNPGNMLSERTVTKIESLSNALFPDIDASLDIKVQGLLEVAESMNNLAKAMPEAADKLDPWGIKLLFLRYEAATKKGEELKDIIAELERQINVANSARASGSEWEIWFYSKDPDRSFEATLTPDVGPVKQITSCSSGGDARPFTESGDPYLCAAKLDEDSPGPGHVTIDITFPAGTSGGGLDSTTQAHLMKRNPITSKWEFVRAWAASPNNKPNPFPFHIRTFDHASNASGNGHSD